MPRGTTGLTAQTLVLGGSLEPFRKSTRYLSALSDGGYALTLRNRRRQSINVQLRKNRAIVRVLNNSTGLYADPLQKLGPAAPAEGTVTQTAYQTFTDSALKGDGSALVFMVADSADNFADAEIGLQSLSSLKVFLTSAAGLARSIADAGRTMFTIGFAQRPK